MFCFFSNLLKLNSRILFTLKLNKVYFIQKSEQDEDDDYEPEDGRKKKKGKKRKARSEEKRGRKKKKKRKNDSGDVSKIIFEI